MYKAVKTHLGWYVVDDEGYHCALFVYRPDRDPEVAAKDYAAWKNRPVSVIATPVRREMVA